MFDRELRRGEGSEYVGGVEVRLFSRLIGVGVMGPRHPAWSGQVWCLGS